MTALIRIPVRIWWAQYQDTEPGYSRRRAAGPSWPYLTPAGAPAAAVNAYSAAPATPAPLTGSRHRPSSPMISSIGTVSGRSELRSALTSTTRRILSLATRRRRPYQVGALTSAAVSLATPAWNLISAITVSAAASSPAPAATAARTTRPPASTRTP